MFLVRTTAISYSISCIEAKQVPISIRIVKKKNFFFLLLSEKLYYVDVVNIRVPVPVVPHTAMGSLCVAVCLVGVAVVVSAVVAVVAGTAVGPLPVGVRVSREVRQRPRPVDWASSTVATAAKLGSSHPQKLLR